MSAIDETGKRYGRLVVTTRAATSTNDRSVQWLCHCDCGNTAVINGAHLRRKTTRSCGCLIRHRGVRRFRLNVLDTFDEDIL